MIQFRKHKIKRTFERQFKRYQSYKPYLADDFSHRCGYCNMKDDTITTYFEIDHYIPSKHFKGKRDELSCDYKNLVYSCRKCNLAKSSSFEGNIFGEPLKNELVYDPASINFDNIFYRNKYGGISSKDVPGKEMIRILKLYLPNHNLSWICEELDDLINVLDKIIASNDYPSKVLEKLEDVQCILAKEFHKNNRAFIRNYNIK